MKLFLLILIPYALALTAALWAKSPRPKRTSPASRGWGNRLRVLIVGATGGTGRELVQRALAAGHEVTALVRKPARLNLEHPNLRVVQGNVRDYASVEAAMHGQNAVVSALGHKRFFYPNRILSDGTDNILRAMKACGVPRLVCESSLGLGSGVGRLGLLFTLIVVPLILPFVFADKVRQEKLIEASEADWIIVRPGMLRNSPARGKYRHGRKVGNYLWTVRISRADVADFMLKQMTDDEYVGKTVGVAW